MFSSMPVPVWDSEMVFLEGPLDTTTVVSDDIWKKFDLDMPLEHYHHRYQNDFLDDASVTAASMAIPNHCETPMMMHFDKLNCQASREIRHHDCMWAGLCISKEHNRTHPAKKDSQIHRRIPAGRSLLIPKNSSSNVSQQNSSLQNSSTKAQVNSSMYQNRMSTKNLESDGDSTRPETPQSSESDTESEEDEVLVFRHEQINLNDIVSMPVSEVTGQQIQRQPALYDRRKQEQQKLSQETVIRNTLMSDHCYHLNQQQPITANKKLEHLGVQTPSDSEEEIDVVSYEKPTRPASVTAATLPTHPSPAEQQHFQLTVNTAFKERHSSSSSSSSSSRGSGSGSGSGNCSSSNSDSATSSTAVPTIPQTRKAPRPRGRPPSDPNRKRANNQLINASIQETTKPPAKRARHHRPYQRRSSSQKHGKSPQTSPQKLSSSDEEPDTEKRSLHNNMERQRRIELRNAFEDLRVLVPEVESKEKAPKVAILRQAASFCDRLTDLEQLNLAKVMELKRKQERLRAQLSHLRRNLAMQR